MSGSQMTAQQLQDANMRLRGLVLQVSSEMTQAIYSGTVTPASTPVLNIPLRNVGLVKGFIVEVTGTITNAGAATASLAQFGPANILSNISFFDLDNYQRINTTGLHLHLLNSQKEGWPFGSALTNSALGTFPVSYGNNASCVSASATIAGSSGTGTFKMYYWVPLAYSARDLRGAVYMGVINATANLQLTFNPTVGVASGDELTAVYKSATSTSSLSITSASVNVYQVYLDQLPRVTSGPSQGAPMLPPLDLATQYRLINTSLTGLSAGQDFPVPFSNFQEFLSLGIIYDQAGTFNSAASDINYFSLTAANTLQLFKLDGLTQLLKQRNRLHTDMPNATYWFDFRDAPVLTNNTGNMQLNINPTTAAANSQVVAMFESLAVVNAVLGATSLPAG